jgi:opacity protein-like surface antigen
MCDVKRNIVMLAAISATLHGMHATAETPTAPDVDSKGRTVEEIVTDARAKVEQGTAPPTPQITKRDDKEEPKWGPITWYLGLGSGKKTHVSLDALYDLRSTQRSNASLQYIEPVEDELSDNTGTDVFFAGVGLNDWLEVELVAHVGSDREVFSLTRVVDTTLSSEAQNIRAHQSTRFSESAYSITFLPQWKVHRFVGVYGRIGVGYADNDLSSNLTSSGLVSSTQTCNPDQNGVQKCITTNKFDSTVWSDINHDSTGFFPIVGVGVDIFRTIRLEYIYRAMVPIGDTTTTIGPDGMFWIRFMNTRWELME